VTNHDVSFRQQASDDSQVYRWRKTDLPRHLANIHGLKSSSAYALHAEAVSLKKQPSLFSFMRRQPAPLQNIHEASSGSAGGDSNGHIRRKKLQTCFNFENIFQY
jgi:hypothetical protein